MSSQRGIHPRLETRLARHLRHPWLQPCHPASVNAFKTFLRWYSADRPLILDSGCGTGRSSLILCERHPEAQVLGVDRSRHRLGRGLPAFPGSVLLLRARLEDFWRLLLEEGIRPAQHYLLYPNPWPKSRHLGRRWHGHPVFPSLIRLAPLELRCNWQVFAEEFAWAARWSGALTGPVLSFSAEVPLSPFEAKYQASGHDLYQLHCVPGER